MSSATDEEQKKRQLDKLTKMDDTAKSSLKDLRKNMGVSQSTQPVPCDEDISGYAPSMEKSSWQLYNNTEVDNEMNGLNLGPLKSFCNTYKSADELNNQCSNLTQYNCNQVGCCIFTSDNKCQAGNATGPLYTSNIDYYYYQNKCYGNNCPKK